MFLRCSLLHLYLRPLALTDHYIEHDRQSRYYCLCPAAIIFSPRPNERSACFSFARLGCEHEWREEHKSSDDDFEARIGCTLFRNAIVDNAIDVATVNELVNVLLHAQAPLPYLCRCL